MHAAADAFLLVYPGFPDREPGRQRAHLLALTSSHSVAVRQQPGAAGDDQQLLLLLGSLFVGSHVLVFFGVTVPVLRIAGGLAVASFGWRLLRDGVEPADTATNVDEDAPVDAFSR